MAYGTNINKMKYKRSFTLVETIIASYILLAGVVTSMTLAQQNINNIILSRQHLTAANLAQEGIELVRNRRDTNFLFCRLDVTVCPDYQTEPDFDPNAHNVEGLANSGFPCDDFALGCRVNDPLADLLTFSKCTPTLPNEICKFLRFDGATGLYNYTTGDPTPFDRKITMKILPPSRGTNTDGRTLDDWQVTSEVKWMDKNSQNHSVAVSTVLTPHW